VYVGLTLICALCFWIAGMSLFDAIGHAFSTLSTGGFSTHDLSLAYFDSPVIESIAIVFMFLGGVNFALHFVAWRNRSPLAYFTDPEFRAYAGVILVLVVFYAATLFLTGTKATALDALRASAFHAVSIQTSTGFLLEDFSLWPLALPVLLIFSSFIGGCAGSTGGGIKVIRWVALWKQIPLAVRQLIHPSAVVTLKIGRRLVDDRVMSAIRAFFTAYATLFVVLMLGLLITGEDLTTAFSAIATCMNNTGPGLGAVVWSFSTITVTGKWICIAAMLLGRLEIFPLLVIATPEFWRT
jgi:trk system potassium uptake protein